MTGQLLAGQREIGRLTIRRLSHVSRKLHFVGRGQDELDSRQSPTFIRLLAEVEEDPQNVVI